MSTINSKRELDLILKDLPPLEIGIAAQVMAGQLDQLLLERKVRFPILEYTALSIMENKPYDLCMEFLDAVASLDRIGGNVLIGKGLQLHLQEHLQDVMRRASHFIISADKWYSCDIIGERVGGYALLHYPEKTLKILKENLRHSDKWVVRSVGVAAHYATKKGLDKVWMEKVFSLLLEQRHSREYQVKRGIGWGAKTICRFHPEIAERFRSEIEDSGRWFQTKVKTGLQRAAIDAQRN